MVEKETLHLGQKVLVGDEKEPGVIDGLTQEYAGVMMEYGGYEYVDYGELYL